MKTVNKVYKVRKFESKKLDEVWEFDKSGEKKEILIKVVIEDGGELQAKGRLKISKKVKDIDVFLRYRVLLLGENAKARVEPELEIESNEIKAGHAASIGRVDQEQLFYLMSRGFNKKEAVKLIVEAFLNE